MSLRTKATLLLFSITLLFLCSAALFILSGLLCSASSLLFPLSSLCYIIAVLLFFISDSYSEAHSSHTVLFHNTDLSLLCTVFYFSKRLPSHPASTLSHSLFVFLRQYKEIVTETVPLQLPLRTRCSHRVIIWCILFTFSPQAVTKPFFIPGVLLFKLNSIIYILNN